MPNAENIVVGALRSMLKRRKFSGKAITIDDELYGDLGLDSLEVAELSAVLEDELGSDPYTEGITPRTVGEVIDFYGERSTEEGQTRTADTTP